MKKDKTSYSSIQINPLIKEKAKSYCNKNGIILSKFVENLIECNLPDKPTIKYDNQYRIVKNKKTGKYGVEEISISPTGLMRVGFSCYGFDTEKSAVEAKTDYENNISENWNVV